MLKNISLRKTKISQTTKEINLKNSLEIIKFLNSKFYSSELAEIEYKLLENISAGEKSNISRNIKIFNKYKNYFSSYLNKHNISVTESNLQFLIFAAIKDWDPLCSVCRIKIPSTKYKLPLPVVCSKECSRESKKEKCKSIKNYSFEILQDLESLEVDQDISQIQLNLIKSSNSRMQNTITHQIKSWHKYRHALKKYFIDNSIPLSLSKLPEIFYILRTGNESKCLCGANRIFRDGVFNATCEKAECIGKYTSKGEADLLNFCKTLDSEATKLRLGKLEVDIFLPKYKLGIEFNGEYYHSEFFKDDKFHAKKQDLVELEGISLLSFYRHQWETKKEIVESIIRNKIGLSEKVFYARKCLVKEITWAECKIFLEENHIQGSGRPAGTYYGCFYGEELLSVMTFGKPMYNLEYEYELIRFCCKKNLRVIGIASKFLSYFKKLKNPRNLLSYANRNISKGNLYTRLGFQEIGREISFMYYNGNKVLSRYQCQKHKIEKLFNKKIDFKKTEKEIMSENGFYRVYDSGQITYGLNF